MADEQRIRKRVPFQATVTLQAAGRKLENLASRDISLKGLFVNTLERLPLNTPVTVLLDLLGVSSNLQLKMKGVVARVEPDGLGIDFTEVDLDSFFHLRNIVSYNSGDATGVDEEIATKPAF